MAWWHINIEPNFSYDEKALDDYLKDIETKLPDQLEQSSYYLESDDELIITKGSIGTGIYIDDLKKDIIENLKKMRGIKI